MIHYGDLTKRQRELLRLIFDKMRENQRPPTIRELQVGMGISSPNGIMAHVLALRKKRFLVMESGTSRGIRLTGVRLTPVFEETEEGQAMREALGEWVEAGAPLPPSCGLETGEAGSAEDRPSFPHAKASL